MAETTSYWPEPELYLGKFHWRPSDPTEACVRFIGPEAGPLAEGLPYEEFMCLYPWLKPYYTTFEKNWRPYWLGYILRQHWWIPIVACTIYGIAIYKGLEYFKDRKPWNFRYTLMAWNLGLSIFSVIGFFRILPTIIHTAMNYHWYENYCFDPWSHTGHNEGGIWIFLFSLSKIAELFDTFFIVVHKKPLIFLHWYHHVTVLLYCWFFLVYTVPAGIAFCLVNYGVHAIMYFYYFLMSARMKPKWMKPQVITIIQILQMVIGFSITCGGIYLNYTGYPHCYTKPINAAPTIVLFGSYFILFTKFFLDRYVLKTSHKPKKEKST